MTEREKEREQLIEICEDLILSCKASLCTDCEHNKIDYPHCMGVHFADHLLANGVIVPPCKVGDTVYIVDGTTDGIVVGTITKLEQNIYTSPRWWVTFKGNYPFFGELESKDRADLLLGKTVFLSREDAEKALKERSEGK